MTMRNLHETITSKIFRSKAFFAIYLSLTGFVFLISIVSSTNALESLQNDSFLSLATLNSDMTTSNYFPTADNITIVDSPLVTNTSNYVFTTNGEPDKSSQMDWRLKVHNAMGKAEYVMIKVKLLNSSQSIPDDLTNQPSPEPAIFELTTIIPDKSSRVLPFKWQITDISESGDGYLIINHMVINDRPIDNVKTKSLDGQSFRILFELWRYDSDSNSFQYSWFTDAEKKEITRSVWNQIWFNIKN